jgi:hypothetical protein
LHEIAFLESAFGFGDDVPGGAPNWLSASATALRRVAPSGASMSPLLITGPNFGSEPSKVARILAERGLAMKETR